MILTTARTIYSSPAHGVDVDDLVVHLVALVHEVVLVGQSPGEGLVPTVQLQTDVQAIVIRSPDESHDLSTQWICNLQNMDVWA